MLSTSTRGTADSRAWRRTSVTSLILSVQLHSPSFVALYSCKSARKALNRFRSAWLAKREATSMSSSPVVVGICVEHQWNGVFLVLPFVNIVIVVESLLLSIPSNKEFLDKFVTEKPVFIRPATVVEIFV